MDGDEHRSLEWFLLKKVAEAHHLYADFLDTQLLAPWGWWALISLASQGLITVIGGMVVITDAGASFAEALPSTEDAAESTYHKGT